jgi:hypothetical protein
LRRRLVPCRGCVTTPSVSKTRQLIRAIVCAADANPRHGL